MMDYRAMPPDRPESNDDRLWNTFVYHVKKTLESTSFQWFIILIIVANAILMGLETFDFVSSHKQISALFASLDYGFLILFTVEIIFQFIAFGRYFFNDPWLLFDLWIIVGSWVAQPFRVLRSLRILRVIRLVARMDTLKKLVQALFASVPKLLNIFLLFLLIFYIYGVMFCTMFKDLYKQGFTDQDYFSNLGYTFYTLFQLLTMDCWSCISSQVMAVYPWAWLPIISFILLSAFIVVNLVIAVICDAISEYQHREIDEQLQGMNKQNDDSSATATSKLQSQLDENTVRLKEITMILNKILQNQTQTDTPRII